MTSFITNVLAFITLISILVAVHEYGHFIVGRWLGMKELRYSVGFGKPIWTHVGKKDATEFCISSIPLGGYVRFLDSREGIVEPEDDGRAFDQRPVAARIAVLFAGPGFNFIFAVLAYWLLLSGGVLDLRPAVGVVTPESYAAEAGLEFGDKIIAVGDVETTQWDKAVAAILDEMTDDGRIPLTLESGNGRQRQAVIDVGDDRTRLTEPRVLWDGVGFQQWRGPIQIEPVVAAVSRGSGAEAAGLKVGDRITRIDDVDIEFFDDLTAAVQPRLNKTVVVEFLRDGREDSLPVVIGSVEREGKTVGLLGVSPDTSIPEDMILRRSYSPIQSLNAAVVKTWDYSAFTVTMLVRMVTGDVSIKNVSGPINIAKIAGESVDRGWRYFVNILAIISISLGILNLLPVPVLDGGQIVYQLVEGIKGRPLSERAQILGQQAGILALLLLMSFAFYNDIAQML